MISHSSAAHWAQGSQLSVFPDGKLPVYSTLLKVTEGIHFIAKPKTIISCTPRAQSQLSTTEEVAEKKGRQFFDNIHTHIDGQVLYYYVRNCINKAKETMVWVNDEGEFHQFA